MDIYFWQNMPAHIQVGALECAARNWDGQVFGVWCEDISADRRKMGWDYRGGKHINDIWISRQNVRESAETIAREGKEGIHILLGIGAYPAIDVAAKYFARRAGSKVGLIAERTVKFGWKKWLRPLRTWLVYREYINKLSMVLAMGERGCRFYKRIGFNEKQLYPYMYQCPFGRKDVLRAPNRPLRFAYVGQLNLRKGVDLLLSAFEGIEALPWSLGIYGHGPLEAEIQRRIDKKGFSDRLFLKGSIAASEVVETLQQYDVACVPSRFDGWGVVTNEALQAGIPVIVSDEAGSSDLIKASGAGVVIKAKSKKALSEAIINYISAPELVDEGKRRAITYSPRIMPEVVGGYLVQVLRHVFFSEGNRPKAPWLEMHN